MTVDKPEPTTGPAAETQSVKVVVDTEEALTTLREQSPEEILSNLPTDFDSV